MFGTYLAKYLTKFGQWPGFLRHPRKCRQQRIWSCWFVDACNVDVPIPFCNPVRLFLVKVCQCFICCDPRFALHHQVTRVTKFYCILRTSADIMQLKVKFLWFLYLFGIEVKCARNRYQFSDMDFRHRKSVHMSLALVTVTCSRMLCM